MILGFGELPERFGAFDLLRVALVRLPVRHACPWSIAILERSAVTLGNVPKAVRLAHSLLLTARWNDRSVDVIVVVQTGDTVALLLLLMRLLLLLMLLGMVVGRAMFAQLAIRRTR